MSTIDEVKYQELVASLSASFGVLEGGSTSILEGKIISSGVNQLNNLSDLYEQLGLNTEGDPDTIIDSVEEYKEEQIVEMLEQSTKMQEDIEEMLKESNFAQDVELEADVQYVQLTLNGALLFDSGKSSIREDAIPLVDKVGEILRGYSDKMIEITGHTDSVPLNGNGKFDDNIDLSTARAKTVAFYIVDNKGINISNIKFSGRGEYEPIASNATVQGRAQNRRVEIKIYNELNSY